MYDTEHGWILRTRVVFVLGEGNTHEYAARGNWSASRFRCSHSALNIAVLNDRSFLQLSVVQGKMLERFIEESWEEIVRSSITPTKRTSAKLALMNSMKECRMAPARLAPSSAALQ